MEFVNPGFLFGLFAIAVPILVHLFNFRRFRKVYFTNVDFIRELKKETQKQSRLKHLLVLLTRVLAIVALVFAFARPYIPVSDNILQLQEQNSISLYIDNSFSMQAESESGTLLHTAVEKAREIASVYKSSDRFQLLTNDFEGRHLRFVSKEEFLNLLDEIEFSPVVKDYYEVYTRQSDLLRLEPARIKSAYVLSDFQAHFMFRAEEIKDSLFDSYFIPMQARNADNLYIDSCWFDAPVQQMNQLLKLYIRIQNSSGNSYEDIPVKLKINGVQRALASFDVDSYANKTVELVYTNTQSGIHSGELEINDYPVSFDDKFYFSYTVAPQINVLSINEDHANFYLNSLFLNDTTVHYENRIVNQLNFSSLQDYQFIILNGLSKISSGLNQEILRFLSAGGSVMIFPPDAPLDESYNEFLSEANADTYSTLDTTKQKVGFINFEHSLYEGVFDEIPENMDLPFVNQHFIINPSTRSRQEKLLELQNGEVFLGLYIVEKGRLYLSAVPLAVSYSSFPQHAIFVPTLYKIAVSSIVPQDLYYTLGKNEVIRVESLNRSADEVMKITGEGGEFEAIPEHRRIGHMEDLYVHGQIIKAGNYFLVYRDDQVDGMSFNYDRTESAMIFLSPDKLKEAITEKHLYNVKILESANQHFVQTLSDMSRGIQLWKWFVIAALSFLLAEVLLLRLWK